MPLSLLMYVMEKYKNKLNIVEDFIKLTNIYFIRRGLCNLNTGTVSRLFPSILNNLKEKENKPNIDIIDEFKFELVNNNVNKKNRMPDDVELSEALESEKLYSDSKEFLVPVF
ncbi:hypothetical protein oki361_16640 [Helicobacter pylori]